MTNKSKADIDEKIIDSATEWLCQTRDSLVESISTKYDIPLHEVGSMYTEAVMRLRNDYLENRFKIEATINKRSMVYNSANGLPLPVINQTEGIITRDYRVELIPLRQARSWVVTRMNFKALDFLKAERRRGQHYTVQSLDEIEDWDEIVPSEHTHTPEDIIDALEQIQFNSEQLQQILAQSIDLLSEKEHPVFVLSFFSGASVAEIAERLDITETNVRSIKSRGLKKLRKVFSDKTGISFI